MQNVVERIEKYTGTRRGMSLTLLVLANLLPLGGVVFLGWDVGYLMLLYWAENIVIGFYTFLKILMTSGLVDLVLAPFFVVHYGGFCAGHAVFIQAFLFDGDSMFAVANQWPVMLVLAALFISHGVSFVANFLRGPERQQQRPKDFMSAPYGRIVILHVTILFGGMGVQALGEPVFMLLVLIAVKIAVDIALHLREHRRIAAPA